MKIQSLITAAIISLSLYACSKSSSSSSSNNNSNNTARDTLLGSISALIDNKLVQFDAHALAEADFLSNGNTITIRGEESTSPYSQISFTLSLSGPINNGTYSTTTTPIGYLNFIYVAPQTGSNTLGSYTNSSDPGSSITINSILNVTDTVATGTFRGGVVTGNSTNPVSHTITDGKFNVAVTF
jgi:hypothetical protein